MKRYALLGAFLAVGVIACQPPLPQAACNTVNPEPASSVTATGITTDNDKLAVLLPTDIDEVQADRLLADPTNIQAGDVIASNCNEGLLRKVTNVTTQSPSNARVSPQGIKKVYIETAATSLEEVITAGEADVSFGDLAFDQADLTSAAPGVRVQEVTGTLTIKNARFALSAADINLNGTVRSTLDPKFNLVFAGGSIKTFEAGLGGSLAVDLNAALTLKAGAAAVSERELWKGEFKRAFLIGAVPVVVVVTPRLLIGAQIGGNATGSVTAGVKPTFNMAYSIKYNRDAPGSKWTSAGTPPTFTLNPTFSYGGSTNVNASAYVRFIMDIKFYGVAGPRLAATPIVSLNLNPTGSTPRATLTAGVQSKGSLAAGFKILGVGMDVSFPELTLIDKTLTLNCDTNSCG
jgi:hypothetical protein